MSDDLHSLSGAYVLDALSETERRDVEVHLRRCTTCADEVASLREVTPLLAETVAVAPPPALRTDILTLARVTRQEPPLVDEPPGQRHPMADPGDANPPSHGTQANVGGTVHPLRGRWRSRWIAVAAAAALVVGGGVTWQVIDRPTTSVTEQVLAAPDARTWKAGTPDGGRVLVTRSTDLGHAVLRLEGLADPGDGRAYQAWLQDEQGEMVSAGVVDPGESVLVLSGDVDAATGVGVTSEPAAGSSAPTTDPVALVELG